MPTKDRLGDLNRTTQLLEVATKKDKAKSKSVKTEAKTMEVYKKEADAIRRQIGTIAENTTKCDEIIDSAEFTTLQERNDNIKTLFTDTERITKSVMAKLKNLNAQSAHEADSQTTTEQRIQRIQYLSLHKEFSEVVEAHYASMERHKNMKKDFLMKMARAVNKNLDDDEIEELMEKDTLGQLFTNNYQMDVAQARLNLQDIEQRHQQLLTIESHIREIRDTFASLALHIEQQQDGLNRIEHYATKVSDDIESAHEQLIEASNKKRANKKMWIAIVGVVAAVLIVLAIVF